jgi:DNA polymerase-3 subunit delta'
MANNRNHALEAIDRAIDHNRLTHALLIKGPNARSLRKTAFHVASRLLGKPADALNQHPDFRILQARNRMCQIGVDPIRELIRHLQHSPISGNIKVAVILEADRMNQEAANAFLKTLEEPPRQTYLVLTSSKPYSLMDTIVSRCLSFWFQEPEQPLEDDGWRQWIARFSVWLDSLTRPPGQRSEIASRIMGLYGLLEGFQACLQHLTEGLWEVEKAKIAEGTPEEECIAMEIAVSRGLRVRMLADIERCLHEVWLVSSMELEDGGNRMDALRRTEVGVSALEQLKGLLEVNLAESRMLEAFFLRLLRAGLQR